MHPHSADPSPTRPDTGASANPVLVEVTRGSMVESRHRGTFAVCDNEGHVVLQAGDIERLVYPRSAIKPLQALALVESGAADAFGCTPAEISLACASHDGEPLHSEAVKAWLGRIGLAPADLECGSHLPYNEEAAHALIRADKAPGPEHNNCSGKHSGFLSVAKRLGVPIAGYIEFGHPVQQMLLGILESMSGLALIEAPRGIDGCGIPQYGTPLGNLALAMARFADPADQPERRQAACRRVREAIVAEPAMIAGERRFCTRMIRATGGRAIVKTGAEGVYCAAIPELGLGVALKIDDGAGRAAEVTMGQLLRRLGIVDETLAEQLRPILRPTLHNRVGRAVGEIRPVQDFPS
ncbi:asparaginase [Tistlia consotensis]|uniref:Asparaginase n=1 Tax=Tistlia consotensis USBA 355 TaxID=560819 RepID=A0A1Y6CLZ6_9PROT|nr:asparaginase [Tistlia consotensis]SMF72775.1 asparaginase [Tistlia consotensis USBA 355]SNS09715.1 asparaginase [Tistlia consotensis]